MTTSSKPLFMRTTRHQRPVQVDDILRLSPSDPRRATSLPASRTDYACVHHQSSDLARALDNYAYDPDDDALDGLGYYADQSRVKAGIRLALATIIAAAKTAGSKAGAQSNLVTSDDQGADVGQQQGRFTWTT